MKTVTVRDGWDHTRYWTVTLIERGDCYGLNDSLRHAKDVPLVEFYSLDEANEIGAEEDGSGRFVARYDLDTLTVGWAEGRDGPVLAGRGIDLDASVPQYRVSAVALHEAIVALTGKTREMMRPTFGKPGRAA